MLKKLYISDLNYKKIQKLKKPIVFLPMAADILHYGHIRILNKSSLFGSVVIGLMTDKGIASYKKKSFFSYKKRFEVLSSLKKIELIIPLEGLIYIEIAEILKPKYFVHGSDWRNGPQAKVRLGLKKIMSNWNGKLLEFPYTKDISSTLIKKK